MRRNINVVILISLLLNFSLLKAQNDNRIDFLNRIIVLAEEDPQAKYYNQISWELRNRIPEKAIEYGRKAIELARKEQNYVELARAYGFTGVAYRNSGDYQQALGFYEYGKQVAKKHNLTEEYGYAIINIANAYIYLEEYDRAWEEIQPIDSIANQLNDTAMMAYYNFNIGRIHFGRNNLKEAVEHIKQALDYRVVVKNKVGQAVCYKYLGDINHAQNNLTLALRNYNKALRHIERDYDLNMLADIYRHKSCINLKKGLINQALVNGEKSIVFAQETQNAFAIRASYLNLAEIYRAKQDIFKELKYMKLAMQYSDSMYEDRLKEKVAYIKFDNVVEQKKTQINVLKKEKQRQKTINKKERHKNVIIIIGFITSLILAIGLVVLLLRRKRDYTLILIKNKQLLMTQKKIEKQKRQIEDSIKYAKRIQNAMLPKTELVNDLFPENFVLYLPLNIVSGDFYYLKKIGNHIIFSVADSTGHGVPGAFVSMLGISLLNEITENKHIVSPEQVLEEMRARIKYSLKQTLENDSQDDGMDMALCTINTETMELEFSGANNPALIVRNNEVIELEPNYNPIGIYFREKNFTKEQLQLQENDTIYLFSDGYVDQFGGANNRRYMVSKLKQTLLRIQKYDMPRQRTLLLSEFQHWKGKESQVDDILIVGVKIKDLKK